MNGTFLCGFAFPSAALESSLKLALWNSLQPDSSSLFCVACVAVSVSCFVPLRHNRSHMHWVKFDSYFSLSPEGKLPTSSLLPFIPRLHIPFTSSSPLSHSEQFQPCLFQLLSPSSLNPHNPDHTYLHLPL